MRAIERFVFVVEDPRRLAALRIGLFGLLAWRIATNDEYSLVSDQPTELFDPVSLFHLLPSMPSSEVALVVQALGVVSAAVAAAGVVPRASFPLAFGCALFLGLMLNSVGKIIHNDVVLMLCLLPLLASPRAACAAWALRLSRGQRPRRVTEASVAFGWPIRVAMIVIALAYFIAGFQKLRYSGIEWATSENLRWVLYASSDAGRTPSDIALFIADRIWLVHALAAGTLALELGFPLCLRFPRLRWIFVPGVVSLHTGIWLAMGLDYSAQFLAVIIVFVNWTAIPGWTRARLRGDRRAAVQAEEAVP